MKDEPGEKIMIKIVGLRSKTYSYLIDGSSENKNQRCLIKRKLKFENFKNYLKVTELERKCYLEKNEININSIKIDHREFLKNQ